MPDRDRPAVPGSFADGTRVLVKPKSGVGEVEGVVRGARSGYIYENEAAEPELLVAHGPSGVISIWYPRSWVRVKPPTIWQRVRRLLAAVL